MALLTVCICFVLLLVIGFPIAFNLILSSILYLLVADYPLTLVPQRMFQGMNGFALLAVPFFILTGQLMVKGSLLKSLTDFVNAFVGHVRGALALVTVGTCLFMGAIVGLAVAETASLGSFLIPMMKHSYDHVPIVAAGVNSISKVHDFFNMWRYSAASGKFIGYGAGFWGQFGNTAFQVYSFAGMPVATAFTIGPGLGAHGSSLSVDLAVHR